VPHLQNEGGNAIVAASIVSSSSSAECGAGLATVLVQHSKIVGMKDQVFMALNPN
jgi:hypothetical protein